MSSPQKRAAPAAAASAANVTASGKSSASEFPPIRARSPKKKDSSVAAASSPSKRLKTNGSSKLPRVSSSVTFANEADRQTRLPDSGEELEVLKCILVREGYLQRLAHASAQGRVSGSQLSVTIDVLDLLRISTIEVVEAIVAWRIKLQRQQQQQSAPHSEPVVFTWNSLNYLLKIGSDLDFLERHQGLIQWLGFTLVRNPFVLPVNLDTRAQLEPTREMPNGLPNRLRRNDSSTQFVQIGGKRNVSDQGAETTAQWRAAQAAALAERKRAKNPYETRVINDEELVPLARSTTRVSSAAAAERPVTASSSLVLPSQIGDLDMTRIRACEQIVLAEEATHGRYTRDIQGLLVPESEAQRRLDMIELSADAYSRHQQTQDGSIGKAVADHAGDPHAADVQRGEPPLPPKSYAKKRAGMLGPISKPQQRKPVRKSPLDRSRGAHLEETLKQERLANLELGLLIDRVREEIERKEMDLAYFESFPGVQLFGGELDEFRRTTRADVAVLRRDLAEKQYVFASRTANVNRKEEIIHVFKENRKSAVESDRSATLHAYQEKSLPASGVSNNIEGHAVQSNQSESVAEESNVEAAAPIAHAMTRPIVHDMCATLIQKIARGKLARAAFEVLKIEYYVGSKYIQAVIRGFLARRRVAKMYWQLTASLVLQRFVRGLLARRLVARMRHGRERQRAALRIQRVLRGYFGRQRMHRVRRLYGGRQQLLRATDDLQLSDLKELADACAAMAVVPSLARNSQTHKLPSLVLGLVRVVMVYTTDHDSDVDVCSVRWKEAAHFLRCSARLQRRMSKIAGVAATGDRYLRTSLLGAALLEMYGKDADFNESTFNTLERGWRAATVLFRWVTAVTTVANEQDVFADAHSSPGGCPFLFAEATDAIEAMLESAEDQENAIHEHAAERRFVPRALVQSTKPRPRAVLLVVAFDVPIVAKRRLVDQLCSALPGIFVVLNRRGSVGSDAAEVAESSGHAKRRLPKHRQQQLDILGADFAGVREALAGGHSAILECDIGLTDAQQRRFLGAFTALKAAIKPSPLCILLRGSLRNRPTHEEATTGSFSPRSAAHQSRIMFDADVKHAFERSATWLHRLSSSDCATEMQGVGASSDLTATAMNAAYVLVMEAVVILLTPSMHYNAPQSNTSGVSWKLARRLLGNPAFFVSKLQRVEYDSISSDNLRALGAYLRHADWPNATLTYAASGGLLHALASWVESVVACAEIARDRHGLAPPITRSTPVSGLFDNVVTYENFQSASVALPMQELLDASLADVRVYRKVHTLDGRRCLLSVFHDCERVYFSAYDPESSWRWQRVIPEEEIDVLLAPNSIERGEDAALKRQPPATQVEMYDRLVRLCLLQAAATSTVPSDATSVTTNVSATSALSPQSQELIVRPPAIRLFRRVLRLGGHRATVTLAELSRGRIQVDVTVHGQSLQLRRVVNLEQILERLSHRESRRVFVPPERLPALVLERLHLFRLRQACFPATPTLSANSESYATLKLAGRTKDTAPGRVVLRKAVRSRWLTSSGAGPSAACVWLFTVVEHHGNGTFGVEVYQPQTSQRFTRVVTKRELQDLGIPALWQHPSTASAASQLRAIVKLFQFEKDPNDDPDATDTRIVSCTLRHHILARFPLAFRFVPTRHHVVDKGGVVRAYVQVETQDSPAKSHATEVSASVRFRVCFPERCEEQELLWKDAEVDSYFASNIGVTWTTALRDERKRMAHELARHTLQWDPVKQRVVATLPCGSFEASPCTRDVGREPRTSSSLAKQATRSKRSLFASHSSKSLLAPPTPSSCVRLLDFDEQSDSSDARTEPRVVFVYDRDELVHTGSYRANGVLVMVQVFMKAVIETRCEPRLPVDRVEQRDSFEVAFDLYHPATSTAQRCVIHGRTELREVVGPERATLIASATLHELMEHIVEARTTVTFNEEDGKRTMHAAFVRDRLYAKQKATPIQGLALADAASNASKLIDAKPDRGLKLLTKARTIRSETGSGSGKVILTVFDVSHTRPQQQQHQQQRTGLQLRVDAYVCDSSKLLSLSLEAADLVHILDEASTKELLTTCGEESGDDQQQRRERLAALVADHVGIERRRDGTPDRLFLVETSVASETAEDTKNSEETQQRWLLGKTVRQIRRLPVVLTLFAFSSSDPLSGFVRRGLEIQCYEAQSSARGQIRLSLATLSRLLGLHEGDFQLDALEGETTRALLPYLLAYVHVDVQAQEKMIQISVGDADTQEGEGPKAAEDHERDRQWHECNRSSQDAEGKTAQSWRGLMAASSTGHELCAVHVAMQASHGKMRIVCSAMALRKRLVATRVFEEEQLNVETLEEESALRQCLQKLRIYVQQLPLDEDAVLKTPLYELVMELSQ